MYVVCSLLECAWYGVYLSVRGTEFTCVIESISLFDSTPGPRQSFV